MNTPKYHNYKPLVYVVDYQFYLANLLTRFSMFTQTITWILSNEAASFSREYPGLGRRKLPQRQNLIHIYLFIFARLGVLRDLHSRWRAQSVWSHVWDVGNLIWL